MCIRDRDAPDAQVREFCHELQDMGLQINDSKGSDTHILGLIGDTKAIAESWVLANPVVETCRRVSEPVSYTHLDAFPYRDGTWYPAAHFAFCSSSANLVVHAVLLRLKKSSCCLLYTSRCV